MTFVKIKDIYIYNCCESIDIIKKREEEQKFTWFNHEDNPTKTEIPQ